MEGTRRPSFAAQVTLVALLALTPAAARAQVDPHFDFGMPEETAEVAWKLSLGAGLLMMSGNANSLTFNGTLSASRNDGKNKLTLDSMGTYGSSQSVQARDDNGDGVLQRSEIANVANVAAKNWNVKLRYDRFFAQRNSIYLQGMVGADEIAGKDLAVSGQVGFSRLLFSAGPHEMVVELGYDFTFESYLNPPDSTLQIHSGRAYVGYKLALSDDINMVLSAEVLSNLNAENTPALQAGPLEDTRVNAKLNFNAKIWRNISFRFNFSVKFDNVPAVAPGLGMPLDGFVLSADKVDTLTDVGVVVNFL